MTALDEALLAAAAENHREWFRRTAGAPAVVAVGGDELCLGADAMIFPGRGLDVDALMTEIRAHACASVGCWSLSADARLGTRLSARGFGWGWRPHWMAVELDAARLGSQSSSLPFAVGLASPPFARTLPYAPTRDAPPTGTFHLGVRLREKVVGAVAVNPVGEVAGIYSMGVVPRVRRRGIGMALVDAACRLAADRGCRHAVLNATDEGARLYRRAGFRSLGWGQTWWYSPRPDPTPRERALVEAIGFGERTALEDLRPSAVELRSPLPGGEAPLELALLTDQPAVGEYLLARVPSLLAEPSGPLGASLLHLAVQHDRPHFVELALARGADLEARDAAFQATALGWAEHFERPDLLERLVAAGASR